MKKNVLFSISAMVVASQSWGQCTPVVACSPDTTFTILGNLCDTVVSFNAPTMTGCPTGTVMQISCEGSDSNFPIGTDTVSYVTMDEVYFFEDFSNNNAGWTTDTDWEIGSATASTGSYNNDDPANDFSCSNNNGIAGVVIGGLAPTAIHPTYYLTSPVVDLSLAPGNVFLDFQRWLNSDYTPYMQNFVEVYDGTSWVQVWASGGSPGMADAAWTLTSYDVTAYKNAAFQVRFGFLIGSSGVFSVSSWNIDDVMLRGDTPTAVGDTCSFTVTINETIVPVPDSLSLPDETGECVTVTTIPTATDNCSGVLTATTNDPLTYTADGSYVLTWTYTDSSGNSVDQTQNIIVDDVTPPVPDAVALADTTGCTIEVVAPTATDNCVGTIIGTTQDSTMYNVDGTYTVTWTFDDGNGNTTTQTQNVIIVNPLSISGVIGDELLGADGSVDLTAVGGAPVVTYAWDNGATTEDINGLVAGDYSVVVTDGNGCTANETFTITSFVGVQENSTYFSVYPNPTSGVVSIVLKENINGTTFTISNSLGQLIKTISVSGTQIDIDLSEFANGIYFIQLMDENSKTVRRIVKK
jgi:hypothetical protein